MRVDGLQDRVAVVTGASGGIGRKLCETLLAQGSKVAGLDLRAPDIDGVLGVAADVADESSVDAAFTEVETALGCTEVLVLNAGIYEITPFEEITLAAWERMLAVNLTGAFLCARRALPAMRKGGYGRIVAVGSSAGMNGGANSVAPYAASKAAIMTMAKSIAVEYAGSGVTANAVAPALIDTEMISSMPNLRDKVPVGRLGTPDDVADLITFLCSDHASYITGEVVNVNGGFLVN